MKRFNADGVACGHITDMAGVFAEPQVAHLRLVRDVVSARLGALRHMGLAGQAGAAARVAARAGP